MMVSVEFEMEQVSTSGGGGGVVSGTEDFVKGDLWGSKNPTMPSITNTICCCNVSRSTWMLSGTIDTIIGIGEFQRNV